MNVIINGIYVLQKGIFWCFLDGGEGIIHKPFPECRGDGAVVRALVARSFMKKFATLGFMGDPISELNLK